MTENKRSYFSTIPGLVTGLAGVLTAIVGLVTVLIQLDIIGGDDADTSAAGSSGSSTTIVGSATTGLVPTAQPSSFSVPAKLTFAPVDPKEKTVTVRNTSATSDLTLTEPSVTGTDKERFAWSYGDCATVLKPNAICNLKVTFSPSGPLRSYTATLQVNARDARSQQVEMTASTLIS